MEKVRLFKFTLDHNSIYHHEKKCRLVKLLAPERTYNNPVLHLGMIIFECPDDKEQYTILFNDEG